MNEQQGNVLKAQASARAAHERLNGTLAALQGRLRPKSIARRAQHGLAERSGGVVDTARRNPAAAAGVAAVGLLLLRGLVRRRRRRVEPDDTAARSAADRDRKVIS